MDQQLSPHQFRQLVDSAYPTYLIDLNQKCFTTCVTKFGVESSEQ